MDRVFIHLQHVRCQTCLRLFCCPEHRVQHERMSHVDGGRPLILWRTAAARPDHHRGGADAPAAPVAPLIRRRFRPVGALENRRAPANARKRLHADALGLCAAVSRQQLENGGRQDDRPPPETPARNVLRAARRAADRVSPAMEDLRPVAESSPTVPEPPPPPSSAARCRTPGSTDQVTSTYVSDVDSPPSMYQTPVARGREADEASPLPDGEFVASVGGSADSVQMFCDSAAAETRGSAEVPEPRDSAAVAQVCDSVVDSAEKEDEDEEEEEEVAAEVAEVYGSVVAAQGCGTTTDRCFSSAREMSSLEENPVKKGFFWTNMARRFRLALRPARPRTSLVSSPAAVVPDVAKFYGNIQPRRPINADDVAAAPPVNARPTLDELRQAHAEARRAVSNASAEPDAQP